MLFENIEDPDCDEDLLFLYDNVNTTFDNSAFIHNYESDSESEVIRSTRRRRFF